MKKGHLWVGRNEKSGFPAVRKKGALKVDAGPGGQKEGGYFRYENPGPGARTKRVAVSLKRGDR